MRRQDCPAVESITVSVALHFYAHQFLQWRGNQWRHNYATRTILASTNLPATKSSEKKSSYIYPWTPSQKNPSESSRESHWESHPPVQSSDFSGPTSPRPQFRTGRFGKRPGCGKGWKRLGFVGSTFYYVFTYIRTTIVFKSTLRYTLVH